MSEPERHRHVIQGFVKERFDKLTEDILPPLVRSWQEVQRRLDELNCSLANRSVPEGRRSKVSELSLQEKAQQAGQGRAPARKRRAKTGKP